MSRKYTKIDQYEKQILSMREEGKTHREIAESLGLEKEQIKKWLRRYRIKKEKIESGIPIRTRRQHRKNSEPKNIIAEQAYEIQRLKIENIPFFRCGTEYIDLLLIRAVGIQAGAELEIRSIVRAQLATVRGTVGTFASGDHMVHGVLNMAQSFVSLVAHLASPRFSSGAIRSL